MFAASFKRSPSAPEVFCLLWTIIWLVRILWNKYRYKCLHNSTSLWQMSCLSEPARSTRFNLANRRLVVESFSHLLSITQVNTLCERLLSLFIFVAATFLFEEPYMEIWTQRRDKDKEWKRFRCLKLERTIMNNLQPELEGLWYRPLSELQIQIDFPHRRPS